MSSSSSSSPAPLVIADRYRIDARLGSGGMGEVFRAHDRVLKRSVALKILRPEEAIAGEGEGGDEDTGKRKDPFRQLLREARLCAALSHPNIVTIFDVGVSDGVAFIAMELIEGNDLRMSAANPSATALEKLVWLRDVASALEAAHAVGLVHRDIKPDNVIVKKDGTVKVLDFGIAKWAPGSSRRPLDATAGATTGPVFAGTPGYMPPEQRLGQVDERSDQYAWGVLAFETLGGTRAPKDRPLSLADVEARIAADVAPTITRATSYRAEDRFPSMRAVLEALPLELTTAKRTRPPPPPANPHEQANESATKTWSDEDPQRAKTRKGSPSAAGRARANKDRRAKVFFAAVAITAVLGLVVAIVIVVIRSRRPAPTPSPTTTTTTTPSGSESALINAFIDSGIDDEPTATPAAPTPGGRGRRAAAAAADSGLPPTDPPSPQVLVKTMPMKGGPERSITIAGFGLGAFTNAQAHRVCERRVSAITRCLAEDPTSSTALDVIRSVGEVSPTSGRLESAAMGWEPRTLGGARLLTCIGNAIDAHHIFEDAGPPARGIAEGFKLPGKHLLGCQITLTPKVATYPPAPQIGSLTFTPPPPPPPSSKGFSYTRPASNDFLGPVRRVEFFSSIAPEYLDAKELSRWEAVVAPRVVPCFNLPRGECSPDFALLHFTGSIDRVTRLHGIQRAPSEHACSFSAEIYSCVTKAVASEKLHVKGEGGSQYQLAIHLYP